MQLPCKKKNLRELISVIGQISFCVLGEEILTNFYATGKKVKIGKILLGQNAFVLDPLYRYAQPQESSQFEQFIVETLGILKENDCSGSEISFIERKKIAFLRDLMISGLVFCGNLNSHFHQKSAKSA